MGQLLVRNIEDGVKEKLRKRARRNGRSMEEEVRDILRSAAHENSPAGGLGSEIAQIFVNTALESPIPEWRGYKIRAASFKR